MFMGWENRYCQDDEFSLINLYIVHYYLKIGDF